MKILLVEDDREISDFIKKHLIAESFTIDIADNGTDGSFFARTNPYDIIILDYSLPVKNGITVCQEIRSSGIETPIIFLTMYSDIKKKVMALDIGADDYMVKPFSLDELRARIYALLRRPSRIESPILTVDDLILDIQKQTVYRGALPVYLTKKEYNLLEYLLRNKSTILSRGMIMEHVWNAESDPFSNTVEAHILNLRKKVNIGKRKELIRNVPGRGYTIDV